MKKKKWRNGPNLFSAWRICSWASSILLDIIALASRPSASGHFSQVNCSEIRTNRWLENCTKLAIESLSSNTRYKSSYFHQLQFDTVMWQSFAFHTPTPHQPAWSPFAFIPQPVRLMLSFCLFGCVFYQWNLHFTHCPVIRDWKSDKFGESFKWFVSVTFQNRGVRRSLHNGQKPRFS